MTDRDKRDWDIAERKRLVRYNPRTKTPEFLCVKLGRWHRVSKKANSLVTHKSAWGKNEPTSRYVIPKESHERLVLRAARRARVVGCKKCVDARSAVFV